MACSFRVREQKFICGKDYDTAPAMQADFFWVSEAEHKASTRKKKELATSIAKEAYNLRKSGRYLGMLIDSNFVPGDFSITQTYDNDHQPEPGDLKRVDKDFSNFIKALYRLCDRRGIEHPKWVCVSEYCTVDPETGEILGRHHNHVVMSHPEGLTRVMVESLWSHGMTRCEPLHFDHNSVEGLAKYIVKNVRCKRHWRQSRGLNPPKMPRPNDGKMSRTKLDDVCRNHLEDREYWEKMYPGYTLDRCDCIVTGNSTPHLIVRMYRKRAQKNGRNLS